MKTNRNLITETKHYFVESYDLYTASQIQKAYTKSHL